MGHAINPELSHSTFILPCKLNDNFYLYLFYCLFTVAYGKHIFVFGGYNGLERKHHGEVYSLDAGVNSVKQI